MTPDDQFNSEAVPDRVQRAHGRGIALGFAQSCDSEVGRLLAVLAGGVGSGGRILEIGTGVGSGTAWIVEGLAGRDVVELVSIEIDEVRHRAAAADDWPAFVDLRLGDVLSLFGALGRFDVIFADAQGGKWDGLDRTIAALEPGGLLVVDDMRRPTVEIASDQRAKTAQVRSTLLSDRRLLSIELDWASGVILARRRAEPAGGSRA
jgi:demethylmenaquinone methyltransferase/2-methoxy-6-polyprenyl-1,4-benzoquinol methylase